MNNYERIKAMNFDELAEFLIPYRNCGVCAAFKNCRGGLSNWHGTCFERIKQWLLQESEW